MLHRPNPLRLQASASPTAPRRAGLVRTTIGVALAVLLVAAPLVVAADWPELPAAGGRDLVVERFAAASAALDRDRREPRGLAAVAGLVELQGELPELARLAQVYGRALDDRDTHPAVRAQVRFRLAALERARGNLHKAAAQTRALGFVTRWRVVGPFDNEGKSAFDAVLPPERGLDLAGRWPGKEREVGWRELPEEAVANGFVHLGATLRPAREVAAYALAAIESPREERVLLLAGASGGVKVWVNGALALQDPGDRPARLDQRGAWVTLARGRNRVLVKLAHGAGRMGFYLRLADGRGEGRTYPATDPSLPHAAAGAPPRPADDPLAALAKAADAAQRARGPGAARAAARARLDLALALELVAPGEEPLRRAAAEARKAAELLLAGGHTMRAPPVPPLAPGQAHPPAPALATDKGHLADPDTDVLLDAARLEVEHLLRRERLEAARAAAPEHPGVLRALAEEELESGRPHEAARLLVRAIAAAPGWAEPRAALADALARAGRKVRGAALAAATADAFPTSPPAVRVAARAARQRGRAAEAAARWRTLLALRLEDGEARGALGQLLLDRGDVAGFAGLAAEALRLDPSDGGARARLGDVLGANGREEEAEAAFLAALALCPDDADALEKRGRARLAAGRAADARQDLARALELRPQAVELKALVESLEPAHERFEKPYVLDGVALAAAAPAGKPDDDALVLGELKVTRVLPSGLSATYHQDVLKVFTARGAEAARRQSLQWTPDRQEVKVERARVIKPNGRVVETHQESERSASEPWYRLYYDTVTRTLTFPALEAGDVLEVAWRVEDTAGENLLSDYFGDLTWIDEPTRKLRTDYVLLVPAGRTIHANAPPDVEHVTRASPGGLVEHRFRAIGVPRVEPEPGMPGWSEVARFVHVSTYASWDEVNRFYTRLVKEQLRPTPELRAEAEALARAALGDRLPLALRTASTSSNAAAAAGAVGKPRGLAPAGGWDPAAKRTLVEAAYGFVVSRTRYVGLEFGIHGFKPYRVDQILARRFGDCKDKASLLHALLDALGIDSRLVLLRMRRLGRLPDAPASLAVFNHAILYVPDLDLWLDGTAAFHGTRELPAEDRGATVLVVNPDGPPTFRTIPDAGPGDNRSETRYEVALDPTGAATVKGSWLVRGVDAPGYRQAYLVADERRRQVEQALNRAFPGLQVQEVAAPGLGGLEADVSMSFSLRVPRWAQPDGDGLRFDAAAQGRGWADGWGSLSSRRYDLEPGNPGETRFVHRYVLPPGWRAVELPPPASGESPHASYDVRWREEAGALVLEASVVLRSARIPAADYPAFRDLAARIDRAFTRKVRIAPSPEGAR